MTTSKPADTIVATMPIAKGAYTMKGPDEVLTMKTLYGKGHSAWRIAAILGCSHHTVLRYVRNGFDASPREQPPSALDAHADFLLERFLRHDGNADVVRQELATELGIQVSLRTVQRALKPYRERVRASRLATPRYETKPGEQLQIDFGAKTVAIAGGDQAVHLFVATLGYSRRMFTKAYPQETQVEWLDGLEAAFTYFGGVPATVLMDNAKALVTTPRQDGTAAVFNERVQAFARYWGFTPRACRPYRARTKGKVERSVGYVKANALAGRTFASWGALDRHLATWLATVADHRALDADGTTPLTRFRADHARLTDLHGKPPFGSPRELERTVTAEAAIVLDTNVYSVPWQLIGAKVQVMTTPRTVSIYHRAQLVAEHPRGKGRHERHMDKAHFQLVSTPTDPSPRDRSLARSLTIYADYVAAPEEATS